MKNIKQNALIVLLTMSIISCAVTSSKSQFFIYKGKIIANKEISFSDVIIYHNESGSQIFQNGEIVHYLNPFSPDSTGNFRCWSLGQSGHEHWELGAMEISITHPDYEPFFKVYTVEELKKLPKIAPEEVGRPLDPDEDGIWILPDIVLVPKDSASGS